MIAPADARPKPRSVQSVVTVPAGARLEVKLAPGSQVRSVRGGTAKRKGRALTIAAKGTTDQARHARQGAEGVARRRHARAR